MNCNLALEQIEGADCELGAVYVVAQGSPPLSLYLPFSPPARFHIIPVAWPCLPLPAGVPACPCWPGAGHLSPRLRVSPPGTHREGNLDPRPKMAGETVVLLIASLLFT